MSTPEPHATTSSEKGRRLAKTKFRTQDRNRLPIIEEVLARKTAPPVCLYNFYLYMRDREHAEEYLDFWLDITEHEILCKHFVKDLKKAGVDVNAEYPELARPNEKNVPKRYSSTSLMGSLKRNMSPSPTPSSSDSLHLPSNPSSRASSPIPSGGPSYAIDMSQLEGNKNRNPRYRDSMRSNTTGNLSFLGQRQITRDDIKFSAERIYYRYVTPQSEKEINLPEAIRERMRIAIEKNSRDDPGVFREAKHEVLESMRIDQFPRFLETRAFGNMTALHTMIRLGIGVAGLFLGFAVELSLIFLDKPRVTRIWGFIPLFIGVINIFANQTELSPLLVLLKISETTFLEFQVIRELFIYKLQIRKGLRVFFESLVVALFLTGIFIAVPGHRL